MKKIIYLILIALNLACANFIAPTGGEPDNEPPKLIHSIPVDQTKNFNGKEIFMEFDELIEASAIYNELIIIPKLENNYEVKVKNNTVKIKFDKEFKDSTTYVLNFKNAIKDLTEKNPANNLKLVFSTYDKIDSLHVKGKVVNLINQEPVLNATVALFPNDTLPLNKQQPLYFTKTDSLGNYIIENIKNNKYAIRAFTDKNDNLIYNQETELIGFLTDSLNVNKNIDLEKIEIYKADLTPIKVNRFIPRENDFTIQLNKNPLDVELKFQNIADSNKVYHHVEKNEIKIFKLTENIVDTLYTNVIVTDSLLKKDTLETKIYFRERTGRKRGKNLLNIKSEITNNQSIREEITYNLHFDLPIKNVNTEKIEIKDDSVYINTHFLKEISKTHYQIKATVKDHNKIQLLIPSNTFESFYGDTNTVFQINNPVLTKEELGLIEGSTNDSTNVKKIAVLINQDNKKEIERQEFDKTFLFEKLIPGTYIIQIIFDENENGIWDPGYILEGKLPEKIIMTKNPIRVRSNYEIRNLILD